MRILLISLLIFSGALALGCEECKTSRDCAPGSVCIDAICEKQGINYNTNGTQKVDADPQSPFFPEGFQGQTTGGEGCNSEDDPSP